MLVVFKTQLLLQMLNGDDLSFFPEWLIRPSWKTKDYKPMLYQFCIANNAVETGF